MDDSKIYIYGKEVVTPYYLNEAVADKATQAYVDEAIANIESGNVDLTNYYTKEETETYVNEAIADIEAGDIDLTNYYTKDDVDEKIEETEKWLAGKRFHFADSMDSIDNIQALVLEAKEVGWENIVLVVCGGFIEELHGLYTVTDTVLITTGEGKNSGDITFTMLHPGKRSFDTDYAAFNDKGYNETAVSEQTIVLTIENDMLSGMDYPTVNKKPIAHYLPISASSDTPAYMPTVAANPASKGYVDLLNPIIFLDGTTTNALVADIREKIFPLLKDETVVKYPMFYIYPNDSEFNIGVTKIENVADDHFVLKSIDENMRVERTTSNSWIIPSTTYLWIDHDYINVKDIRKQTGQNGGPALVLETGTQYTEPYTPTYDGSPATKKYVDDMVASIEPSDGAIVWDGDHTTEEAITLFQKMWDAHVNGEALPDVRVWDEYKIIQYRLFNISNVFGTIYAAFACINTALNAVINRRAYHFTVTDGVVTSIDEPQQTSHAVLPEYSADNTNGVLRVNNTTEFTPTNNYNPATKKYVDDAIATVAKGDTILVTIKTDSQNSVKTQLQEKVYPLIQSADIPNEKIIINFCKGTLTSSYNINGLFYVGSVDSNRFKLYAHTKETESEENTDSYCYTALYDVGQVLVCELSGDTITSLKIDQASSQRGWFLEINPQNYVETKPFLATKTYQPATKAYVDNTIQANMQVVKVDNLPTDKVVQTREGSGTIGMIYVTKLERTLQNTASSVSMKLIDEFATNPDNQALYGRYFMVFGHRSSTAHNKVLGYMTDYPELLQMASSSTMAFWGLYDANKPVYSLTTNADSTEVIVNKITSNVSTAPYTSTWYWNTGSGYQSLYLNANCDIQYYNSSSLSGIRLEFDNQTGSNGAGEIQIMPNCPVLFYLDGKLTPPHGESVLGYKEGTRFLINGNLYVSKFDNPTTGSTISYELYIGGDYATKEELNNAIGNITSFSLMPVEVLPTENIQTNVIYLLPSENPEEENVRVEYAYINGAWEKIGTTEVDLSNYYTKTEVNTRINNAVKVLPTKDYVDSKVETAIQGLTGEELDSSLNNGQLNVGDSITCTQDYLGKYEQGNIYLVQEKERGEVSIVQQLQDLGFNVSISSRLLANDIKYFYIVEYGDEGDMYCAYSKVPLNVSGSKFPSDGWKTFSVRKMNDSDPNFYYAQWDTNKNLSSMTELTSSTNDGKYWASQFSSDVVATYTNDPAAASLYTPYVVDPTELVKYTINITPKTDLSNYMLKTEVEANYYSKEEIDAKFAEIMTAVIDGGTF